MKESDRDPMIEDRPAQPYVAVHAHVASEAEFRRSRLPARLWVARRAGDRAGRPPVHPLPHLRRELAAEADRDRGARRGRRAGRGRGASGGPVAELPAPRPLHARQRARSRGGAREHAQLGRRARIRAGAGADRRWRSRPWWMHGALPGRPARAARLQPLGDRARLLDRIAPTTATSLVPARKPIGCGTRMTEERRPSWRS